MSHRILDIGVRLDPIGLQRNRDITHPEIDQRKGSRRAFHRGCDAAESVVTRPAREFGERKTLPVPPNGPAHTLGPLVVTHRVLERSGEEIVCTDLPPAAGPARGYGPP